MDERLAKYVELNRQLVTGRRVILGGNALVTHAPMAARIRALGAEAAFIVATTPGTGEQPPDDVGQFVLDLHAENAVDDIRRSEHALAHPTDELVAALDAFDPERDALVLLAYFFSLQDLAGRPVYGARSPAVVALEDKSTADALFDTAGVPRLPSAVVASGDDLAAAARPFDAGQGTVWSGDAREGFNGGAVYVRLVRDQADADAATVFFRAHCDRVRISPFADGIACSIHGFVTAHGTAAFRPVEQMVFRRPLDHPDRARFVYGGTATFWDPRPDDREEMRDAVRRLGDHLAATVDYRGVFTIDGILTADGFRATECNPRFGAALGYTGRCRPELALTLLHYRAVAGEGDDIDPVELESLIVPEADAHRSGSGHGATKHALEPDSLLFGDQATITVGPSTLGAFVVVTFDATAVPIGPSVAPLVVEALALVDERCGTAMLPLEAARNVRPATRSDSSGSAVGGSQAVDHAVESRQ